MKETVELPSFLYLSNTYNLEKNKDPIANLVSGAHVSNDLTPSGVPNLHTTLSLSS